MDRSTKERRPGVYQIRNRANGKVYIGSAVSIWVRWLTHRSELRRGVHHCPPLQRAWDKYGEDQFEFSVLEVCERDQRVEVEQRHMDARQPEYNVALAAGYRTFYGRKHTPEALEKLSASKIGNQHTKGKIRPPEAVAATAAAHRCMKRSEETRAKISAAMTGKKRKPRSDEYRAKMSLVWAGKQKSPEHMAALQEGRKRRVWTDEQRAAAAQRIRDQYDNGTRSRDRSAEYREKIAESLRARNKAAAC